MDLLASQKSRQSSTRAAASSGQNPGTEPAWRPWVWMTLGCLFFGGSALNRAWQDYRFDSAKNEVVKPIFPLKDLPKTFGDWRAKPGEAVLNPEVAKVAGSADSLVRDYVDESTGVVLTVLVLYGRAESVVGHTPEACYPAVGFEPAGDAFEVGVPVGTGSARLRSLLYVKKGGAVVDREEVYYAFRHRGEWMPDVPGNWRDLRFSPPVFKVQIQRRFGENESRRLDNPAEKFLTALLTEIDRRASSTQDQLKGAR